MQGSNLRIYNHFQPDNNDCLTSIKSVRRLGDEVFHVFKKFMNRSDEENQTIIRLNNLR